MNTPEDPQNRDTAQQVLTDQKDPDDSRADVTAALALVLIASLTVLYWVSGL